jgi:hypothetical protein
VTAPLSYQPAPDPAADRSLRLLRRLVLACALIPMVLGILDLLLFAITDLELFAWFGLILLPIGGLFVLAGLGLLVAWFIRHRVLSRGRGRPMAWPFPIVACVLLLSNFAVAIACMWLGMLLVTAPRISIAIENQTGAPIDLCRVQAGLAPETKTGLMHDGIFWFHYRRSRVRAIAIHLEQAGKSADLTPPVPTDAYDNTIHYRLRPGLVALRPGDAGFVPGVPLQP